MQRESEDQEVPSGSPAKMSTSEKFAAFNSAAVTGLGSYVTSGSYLVMCTAGVLTLILLAVVFVVAGR